MKMKWIALAVAAAIPAAAMAIGGASGPKIDYEVQGHIGEVMGNPYGIAPLTAVIRDGGYTLADVTVHIVPKQGGQKISYKVSRSQLLTHGAFLSSGCIRTISTPFVLITRELTRRAKRKSFQTNISSMRLLFTLSLQETPWSA